MNDFKVGDRIEYRLPRGWEPGTVVKVTAKRIHVKLDDLASVRYTVASHLRHEPPQENV